MQTTLQHIIPSKTRRKILALFFEDITRALHLRKIGREVEEEINAVKRELDILTEGKVLRREKRLNKVVYSINEKYLFFDEFLRIFAKEGAFVKDLLNSMPRLGKIKFLAISLSFIKKKQISQSDVYMLIVGVVVLPELAPIIQKEEERLGIEINYTAMTEEECAFRKKNNDPFIWTFLRQPKVMIVGNEEELVK